MKRIFLYILVFCIYECTASPRYSSGTSPKKNKVTKKVKTNSSRYSSGSSSEQSQAASKKDVFRGVSSYYGPNFHGKLTANGEVFDMYGVTAAHKELPFNTVVRVTNLDNDKALILRINDRGPYIGKRILDCSYGAAKKLDFMAKGTANVEIRVIELGDGVYMHHNE